MGIQGPSGVAEREGRWEWSVRVARVDGVEPRPGPEVQGLLRGRVVALGDLQGLEGNPEVLERLASEGGAADERAYLPAAAALVAGENVVLEGASFILHLAQ